MSQTSPHQVESKGRADVCYERRAGDGAQDGHLLLAHNLVRQVLVDGPGVVRAHAEDKPLPHAPACRDVGSGRSSRLEARHGGRAWADARRGLSCRPPAIFSTTAMLYPHAFDHTLRVELLRGMWLGSVLVVTHLFRQALSAQQLATSHAGILFPRTEEEEEEEEEDEDEDEDDDDAEEEESDLINDLKRQANSICLGASRPALGDWRGGLRHDQLDVEAGHGHHRQARHQEHQVH